MTGFVPSGLLGKSPTEEGRGPHVFSQQRITASDKDGTPSPLFPAAGAGMTGAEVCWTELLVERHHPKPF